MTKMKKTAYAITVAIVVAAAAGAWYLWMQGIIGKHPKAPLSENFMVALQAFHANEDQRSMTFLGKPGRCLKLPPAPEAGKLAFTELSPVQVPGQYLFPLSLSDATEPAFLGSRKTLQALTLAGFLAETTVGNNHLYRLKWAAALHIIVDSDIPQFCALYGRFGPIKIVRTKESEDSSFLAARYDVTYLAGVVEPAAWLANPEVQELIKDGLKSSRAVAREEVTRQLVRGKDGWIVEGSLVIPEKMDAERLAGGNAWGAQLDALFANSAAALEGKLEACLPLPDILGQLKRAQQAQLLFLPEPVLAEYQERYVAPDLMFDRDGIFATDPYQAAGRMRLLRRLAKHGVVVGQPVDESAWPKPKGAPYGVIGGTVYRVAPELSKFVVRRKDFSGGEDRDPRYCLRFAEPVIHVIQSRFAGYHAAGSVDPSYMMSGRIAPNNIYAWFKPLLEAKNIAEANVIADGVYFRGRVTHSGGKLVLGNMRVAYPISIASPSLAGPMQDIVNLIESRMRIATNILDNQAVKDFLANDPEMMNRAVSELVEKPAGIATKRGQCNERRKILADLREPLAELQADEDYQPIGATLARRVQKKRGEIDALCDAIVRRYQEILKTFPHLRTPAIDQLLRHDPPPTRTLIPDPPGPRLTPVPMPSPSPKAG